MQRLRLTCHVALLAAILAASLAARGAAAADPVRVEVEPFENGSALPASDAAVLDSLMLSALSELPGDRFDIAAGQASADPACDKACRTTAAGARGARYLVIGSIAAFGDGFLAALEAYDAASGQLLGSATTGAISNAADLLAAVKAAAAELRTKIDPQPAATTPASPQPTATLVAVVGPRAATATLRVVTTPPGATVYVQRIGNRDLIGRAPLEKILLPLDYRVIARLEEHEPATAEVRLDPFEEEMVHLTLRRIYPMSPYKKWGHLAFWPGLAVTAFGFCAMGAARNQAFEFRQSLEESDRENARAWTGGMWAGLGLGAALMTTGIILWTATPSSKEHWERSHGAIALSPSPDGGFVAAYGRRF